MRVKLAALTFGLVVAVLTLLGGLKDGTPDATGWIGLILFSLAAWGAVALLYYYGNRLLHKHGWSLYDDDDFEQ
jgi:hypothetical protein